MPCNITPQEIEWHRCIDHVNEWTDEERENYYRYDETPCYVGRRRTPIELGMEALYEDNGLNDDEIWEEE